MDNIDRFCRVLYKDCDLMELFSRYESNGNLDLGFTMDNKKCKKRMLRDYAALYPYNYNGDVLEMLLQHYSSQPCGFAPPNDGIGLLVQAIDVLEKYEKNSKPALRVQRERAFEWEGLCDKIDNNILIALYCSSHPDLEKEEAFLTVFSETGNVVSFEEKNKGLTYCENHMHLKGSGYSTEMSMQAILHSDPNYAEGIVKNLTELAYSEKLLGDNVDEASQLIRKICLLRGILFDMCQDNTRLSKAQRQCILKYSGQMQCNYANTQMRNIDTDIEEVHVEIAKKLIESTQAKTDVRRHYVILRHFFYTCFCHMKKHPGNQEFRYLLNLYISAISKLRFCFIQDNLGMGFERFKLYEDRKATVIGDITLSDADIYASVFDRYYQEKNIEKVEFRIAPCKSVEDYHRLTKQLRQLRKTHWHQEVSEKHFGLVVHFIKTKDKKKLKPKPYQHRYEQYLDAQERQLQTLLCWIENASDEELALFVGIDSANYEIECPPEVFAGMFYQIQEQWKIRYGTSERPRIHQTYHVGEDFRTITTGMRRVWETMEFLEYKATDRLGHALAIGLDVDDYFEHARNYVSCTYLEWVDDLVWMYGLIQEDKHISKENREVYTHILQRYFTSDRKEREMLFFPKPIEDDIDTALKDYYSGMKQRGAWMANPEMRNELEHKYPQLETYFRNIEFYNLGEKPMVTKIDKHYLSCVKWVQDVVATYIIEAGFIIEANPTSNRKISSVQRHEELPVVQFIRRFAERGALDNICINTDDSAIFQTNSGNEYELIGECVGQFVAPTLLKRLASTSRNACFVP